MPLFRKLQEAMKPQWKRDREEREELAGRSSSSAPSFGKTGPQGRTWCEPPHGIVFDGRQLQTPKFSPLLMNALKYTNFGGIDRGIVDSYQWVQAGEPVQLISPMLSIFKIKRILLRSPVDCLCVNYGFFNHHRGALFLLPEGTEVPPNLNDLLFSELHKFCKENIEFLYKKWTYKRPIEELDAAIDELMTAPYEILPFEPRYVEAGDIAHWQPSILPQLTKLAEAVRAEERGEVAPAEKVQHSVQEPRQQSTIIPESPQMIPSNDRAFASSNQTQQEARPAIYIPTPSSTRPREEVAQPTGSSGFVDETYSSENTQSSAFKAISYPVLVNDTRKRWGLPNGYTIQQLDDQHFEYLKEDITDEEVELVHAQYEQLEPYAVA